MALISKTMVTRSCVGRPDPIYFWTKDMYPRLNLPILGIAWWVKNVVSHEINVQTIKKQSDGGGLLYIVVKALC